MRKILFMLTVVGGLFLLGIILEFMSPFKTYGNRNMFTLSSDLARTLIISYMIVSAIFIAFLKRVWVE